MFSNKYLLLIIGLMLVGYLVQPVLGFRLDLLAQWNFDNGTADDSSGNNLHGYFMGDAHVINDPTRGLVLNLSGDPNDYVDCGNDSSLDLSGEPYTVMAWFKVNRWDKDSYTPIVSKGSAYRITQYSSLDYIRHYTNNHYSLLGYTIDVNDGQWHHAAAVYDGTVAYLYIDGLLDSSVASAGATTSTYNLRIGSVGGYAYRSFNGQIDDVRIHNASLPQSQIRQIVGLHTTYNPSPSDRTGNESINPTLTWSAGDLADATNGQDLYFGASYQDVLNRDPSVHIGKQDGTTYDPGQLLSGATYYWAVDQINTGHPNSPWPGDVWSFWTTHEGYYKDLFMDGGVSLTSRTVLPASDWLNLKMEYLATSDQATQNNVMLADINDDNGRLLYPDGQPRFRCIYVNGGSSLSHGDSLGEIGRQRIRDFYYNGGSYTGSCAGSIFTSIRGTTSKDVTNRPEYIRIWPGRAHYTQLSTSYVGMAVPPGSPLLDYYDFGGDNYVAQVYQNVGNYTIEGDDFYWSPGTEKLATYALPIEGEDPDYQPLIGNVSVWAHKHDLESGHMVVIGGHPESVTYGDRRELMAGIYQYALAKTGLPDIKANLQNTVARNMNDNQYPGHEKIGDKQYHHFTVNIPPGMTQLTINLDGDDVHDLDLFARSGDFAFRGRPDLHEATNNTSSDETITINNPAQGLWYIGVKGYTTVTTAMESWGQDYTGNLEVLNGMPYSITASWDAPRGDLLVDGQTNLIDLKIFSDQYLTQSYTPYPVGPLTGHWEFDEFTGGYAYDASGKGHLGLVSNSPTWRPDAGRFGGALSFDEIDDFVRILDYDYTNAANEFTVSFWFKIDNVVGTGYQYMFSHGEYDASASLNVYFRESGISTNPECISTRVKLNDGTVWHFNTPTAYADGNWHMYSLTVSATNGSVIYIDANPVSTNPTFLAGLYNPLSDVYIAGRSSLWPARHYGNSSPDDGLIDDVRIYSIALSPSNIASVYAGFLNAPLVPQSICNVYPLGDLNEDGKINLRDFAILSGHWMK
ncbi:MAG: hypothetical protein GY869_26690 [Planctomycetes bacterium]|nr:hypothetical protein [Planctomycetota bacterium]